MPRLNTQILTATNVLSPLELERLSLSNFRCPDFDKDALCTIEDLHLIGFFTPENIDIILDVSDYRFYQNGEYTYMETQYRNVEHFISSLAFDNEQDSKGRKSGLIESDISKLTTMHVMPTALVDDMLGLLFDLSMEALHLSFKL